MDEIYLAVSTTYDSKGSSEQVTYHSAHCVECGESGSIESVQGKRPRVVKCSKCGKWVCRRCLREHHHSH